MNRIGFRGFAKPVVVGADLVAKKTASMNLDGLFVYWTGNAYRARKASGRSNALATITEKATPVPVKVLIERASKARGDTGYSPDLVRAGLFLHQGSKPVTYLALERREDGAYLAARDIANPDPAIFPGRSFKAGDVVFAAEATKALKAPKAPKAPKALAGPKAK